MKCALPSTYSSSEMKRGNVWKETTMRAPTSSLFGVYCPGACSLACQRVRSRDVASRCQRNLWRHSLSLPCVPLAPQRPRRTSLRSSCVPGPPCYGRANMERATLFFRCLGAVHGYKWAWGGLVPLVGLVLGAVLARPLRSAWPRLSLQSPKSHHSLLPSPGASRTTITLRDVEAPPTCMSSLANSVVQPRGSG